MAKQSAGPLFFVMVVFGGVMGLLAAYGALVLIRDNGVVTLDQPAAPVPTKQISKEIVQPRPIVAPVKDLPAPQRPRPISRGRMGSEETQPVRPHVDVTNSEETTVVESPPERPAAAAPSRHVEQSIPVKLESRTLRVPITISGQLKIVRVEGCDFALTPSTGLLVGSVAVNIKGGPRDAMLKVTINTHGDDRSCLIEPVISTDDGKTLPFTISSLDAIAKRLAKNSRTTASDLKAQQAEHSKIAVWLKSPGVRALSTYNAAVKRSAELDALIPETTQAAADLDAQLVTASNLTDFAKKLSGTISLVVESVPDSSGGGLVTGSTPAPQ